jgi:hypothetical protein
MCHTCKYSRGDNNTGTSSRPQNVSKPCPKRASNSLDLGNVPKTGFPNRFPIMSQTVLGKSQLRPKRVPKPMFWEHSHKAIFWEEFENPKKCWKMSQNTYQPRPKHIPNKIPKMSQNLSSKVPFPKHDSQTCPKRSQIHPILSPFLSQNAVLRCLWDAFGTLLFPLVHVSSHSTVHITNHRRLFWGQRLQSMWRSLLRQWTCKFDACLARKTTTPHLA